MRSEVLKYEEKIYAIVIRADKINDGVKFYTPNYFSQQLGTIIYPKNYKIKKHKHKRNLRKVFHTQETLIILEGKIRVSIYIKKNQLFKRKILKKNDIILLAFGWHEFDFLEKSKIIEVKQGPYIGIKDKKF